ncbi:MAG: hypothetical protein ABSB75_04905, partial [Candidatus Limnocylindrales bacterium]
HITLKQAAFADWYDRYFEGIRTFPRDTTCGPVETATVGATRIGILPINSALFSQGDNDHEKLLIGRRCLDVALTDLRASEVDLRVALIHHPLDWLSPVERANVKAKLQRNVDVMLRGHLHETEAESVETGGGTILYEAAGASYQEAPGSRCALYASYKRASLTVFPIRYEDSPNEVWTVDPSLYPDREQDGYARTFLLPRLAGPATSDLEVGCDRLSNVLRCPPAPVRVVDPYALLGISQSAIASERFKSDRPPYVPRTSDAQLNRLLGSKSFVLVWGPSKSGKSRSAYEALLRVYPDHTVIVPTRPKGDSGLLRDLPCLLRDLRPKPEPVLLWLDELSDYLRAGAFDADLLYELEHMNPRVVVVGTIEAHEFGFLRGRLESDEDQQQLAPDSLEQINRVLDQSYGSTVEIKAALDQEERSRFEAIYTHLGLPPNTGLGAFLIGGPRLIEKLTMAPSECPQGAAVIHAAIDWRRMGARRPISRSELRVLFDLYLEHLGEEPRPSERDFECGLQYAARIEPGSLALVAKEADGTYRASDYAVAVRSGDFGQAYQPVPGYAWRAIADLVDPDEQVGVALAAYLERRADTAELAWKQAILSGPDESAARAILDLADYRAERGRRDEAITLYDQFERSFGRATDPGIRAMAARALARRSLTIDEPARREEAIAGYDEVARRFGDMTEPSVRHQVAVCLINKALALDHIGRPEAAIDTYGEVEARFASAPEPDIQLQVARALVQKGMMLATLDRFDDAVACCDDVGKRFGGVETPRIRAQVATALFNRAWALGHSGRRDDAGAGYEELSRRFSGAPESSVRRRVAEGLVNLAYTLDQLGRHDEAAHIRREMRSEFPDETDPEVRRTLHDAVRAPRAGSA